MAKIRRQRLLQALEAVMPGLAKKAKFDQSTCFAFVNGRVLTYNDEISCRAKSQLPKDLEGAVDSAPMLAVIRKMEEEEIEIVQEESQLIITGKSRRKVKLRMEPQIDLPIEKVERPGKSDWKSLSEHFSEAISVVSPCAGTNEAEFAFTCIHMHPKFIEACDNNQITRFRLKTKIKKPILMRQSSIKHVAPLDMTEFAETDTWIHFRNPAGVEFACKRIEEEYPDLSKFLKAEGTPTTLPKGIAKDCNFAEIFTSELEKQMNLLVVTIKSTGRMLIRGVGISGEAEVPKKIKYSGPNIAFCIPPQLLAEITKKHRDCQISGEHIRVDGGRWTYVGCLGDPVEEAKRAEAAAEAAKLESEAEIEQRDSQWDEESEGGEDE